MNRQEQLKRKLAQLTRKTKAILSSTAEQARKLKNKTAATARAAAITVGHGFKKAGSQIEKMAK